MRFGDRARLDPGQVQDRRRGGGIAVAGGGGVVGLLVVLALTLLGGGDPSTLVLGSDPGGGGSADLAAECQTGSDANQREDCRIVGVVNSVQDHWAGSLPGYRQAPTALFSGSTTTGCGVATSATGPFYCPADETIYLDLTFFDELSSRFGASGGAFAQAYVVAHEYGHHVEHVTGVLGRADRSGTGPDSAGVQIELMADCLAGVWAHHAEGDGLIAELTDQDIRDGLSAAAAVGDDRIQQASGREVDPEAWTHGSAAQRQQWFTTGYQQGTLDACDTFEASLR